MNGDRSVESIVRIVSALVAAGALLVGALGYSAGQNWKKTELAAKELDTLGSAARDGVADDRLG